jgi:hypothetical protein
MARRALTALLPVILAISGASTVTALANEKEYEVWLVDQSNSSGLGYGGSIHVFDGRRLETTNLTNVTPTDVIDLGGATSALCFAKTGVYPVRPHMVVFNRNDTHAALTFVATGHVVFFDAVTREPLECLRMAAGVGGARQAHAGWPTSDDQYLLVANQNGKRFERIQTDYTTNTFTYEPGHSLELASGVTPNGVARQDSSLRPDNAPICPFVASDNGPAFVSLRGGGMFVVDWRETPMSIIGEYDRANVPANGCGFIEARGWVFADGGGGTANNLDEFVVYRFPMSGYSTSNPPNAPARELLYTDPDAHGRDAHGPAVTKDEKYTWIFDRGASVAEVFRSDTGERVNTVNLVSRFSADPTVDLIGESPDRKFFFGSLRGPNPLSGDPHSSTGTTPGLLVMKLKSGGTDVKIEGIVRISNRDAGGVERADGHGIRVRLKD